VTSLSVSVIVVSRGRPKLLQLCLKAISQLRYDKFELVVVADRAGLAAVKASELAELTKTVLFEEPNVATARNLGIAQASGDLVAFIDGGAVPEPGWLHHLAAVFADQEIAAAGGYVRGHNGISYQYSGKIVDAFGASTPLRHSGDAPIIIEERPEQALKTIGTNSAFRRDVLVKMGGFNPAFAYYLDETELNIRLAKAGFKTAIVPLAQVHHHRAASEHRAPSGMPRSLFQIGASAAALLRIHAPDTDHALPIFRAQAVQRNRLLGFMVSGACEPNDIKRLLKTYEAGVAAGLSRPISPPAKITRSGTQFVNIWQSGVRRRHKIVSGFRLHQKTLRQKARTELLSGSVVSLYIFSRTALFHKVRFHPDGFWEQSGGLFGRATRSESIFKAMTLAKRVEKEDNRVAAARHP